MPSHDMIVGVPSHDMIVGNRQPSFSAGEQEGAHNLQHACRNAMWQRSGAARPRKKVRPPHQGGVLGVEHEKTAAYPPGICKPLVITKKMRELWHPPGRCTRGRTCVRARRWPPPHRSWPARAVPAAGGDGVSPSHVRVHGQRGEGMLALGQAERVGGQGWGKAIALVSQGPGRHEAGTLCG